MFQYLRQVSEYKFVYDSDAVKQFQPVSVDLKGVGLEEVLEDCLKGSPFVFLIEDDLVIYPGTEKCTAETNSGSENCR